MSGRPFQPDDREPVDAAVAGFARAHAGLVEARRDPLYLRARYRAAGRRVGLVSGGGSGHEPLHAGFLGAGMLDAVAPGRVFASPDNRQVLEAGRAAAGPDGLLYVVKNYTGDRINFGIAAERLRHEGVEVRRVLVDDDLATDDDRTATGRRGTGATVAVEKLLGAAADRGLGLDELAELGGRVAAASRSLAVASRAHTAPDTGAPAFALGDGELEYGVGIHGERARTSIPRPGLSELVGRMVRELTAALPGTGGELLAIVNGLGATTNLELYGVYDEVCRCLGERGLTVAGSLVGTYVAALDMHGFSITLTRLERGWLDLWQAPVRTPAFPGGADVPVVPAPEPRAAPSSTPAAAGTSGEPGGPDAAVLRRYAEAVEAAYADLTDLDRRSGDGDFGDNLRGAMRAVVARLDAHPGEPALDAAASVFLDSVGGTSGPLYGLLFAELAAEGWRAGVGAGLAAVQRVGKADRGDRTMVDALAPAADVLAAPSGTLTAAARAAEEGAAATADRRARRGRASYVGERAVGAADPGATGVALLLRCAATELEP